MNLTPSKFAARAALIALATTSGMAHAQESGHGQPVIANLTGRYVGESNLGSGGKVSSATGGLGVIFPVASFGDFQLSQGISYEREQVDFNHFDQFLPGKAAPFKGANDVTLSPSLTYKWSDNLSLRTSFSAQYSGADSAKFGDSITFGGLVLGSYKVSDSLTVGVGFGVSERLARTTRFMPLAGVEWQISEHWSLSTLRGPNIRLSYLWSSNVTFFAQGEYEYRDIRLKDSSSISGGVVRYRSFPLSLGVDWKITDQLSAEIFGGAAIAQQYDFTRQDGGSLRKSDEKTAPFGALALSYRF